MDSDESGRSESEFYYPEEETFNHDNAYKSLSQLSKEDIFFDIQKKNKYVIYRAR